MTQTNQNKDYSWLSKIINHIGGRNCGNPYCEAKILEPSEAEVDIQSHIDEHYIGKGEAEPTSQFCSEARCIREVLLPHIYCVKHEDANSRPTLAKVYTEQEVEQRCIEARIDEKRKWLAVTRRRVNPATGTYIEAVLPITFYEDQLKLQLYTESEVERGYIEVRKEENDPLKVVMAQEIAWHEKKTVKSAHKHRSGPEVYLSNPPQYKCIDCGETFFAPQLSTNNKDTLERSE